MRNNKNHFLAPWWQKKMLNFFGVENKNVLKKIIKITV